MSQVQQPHFVRMESLKRSLQSPTRPKVRRKRSRVRRASRVLPCNDSTGHQALMALEQRLTSIKLTSDDSLPKHFGDEASLVKPAPPTKPHHARPHFIKPLVAKHNATSVSVPSRPEGSAPEFGSPRRPVSAGLPRRRPRPSILKRRRTQSATIRKEGAVVDNSYVPNGMIVSLPPLLPTHSLLADAYNGGYDCGSGSDIEVDTDDELIPAGAFRCHGKPQVVVPSSFEKDMLVSLDDSLEESGFKELLASVDIERLVSEVPDSCPLTDSPALVPGILSPAWNNSSLSLPRCSSQDSFAGLPSLEGFTFPDIHDDMF